jgi:hypothetical protein
MAFSDQPAPLPSHERRTPEDVAADKALGTKLRKACARTGTTDRDVAEAFGVCTTTVAKMVVGSISMRARHVEMLPEAAFAEFLSELASPRGYAVVKLPDSDEIAADAAIEWTERNSAAFSAFFRAVQDLRIDRAESIAIETTGMSLVRTVMGAVVQARYAQREGVVGIPAKRSSSTETKAAR